MPLAHFTQRSPMADLHHALTGFKAEIGAR